MKTNDLTKYAVSAYQNRKDSGFTANPNLYSSPAWYAHELGIFFEKTGRTIPKEVRMSRGYSIRANGMLFKIHETKEQLTFERIE